LEKQEITTEERKEKIKHLGYVIIEKEWT